MFQNHTERLNRNWPVMVGKTGIEGIIRQDSCITEIGGGNPPPPQQLKADMYKMADM